MHGFGAFGFQEDYVVCTLLRYVSALRMDNSEWITVFSMTVELLHKSRVHGNDLDGFLCSSAIRLYILLMGQGFLVLILAPKGSRHPKWAFSILDRL